MKKFLFSVLLAGVALFAGAQEMTFKPFKVDFAIGYAISTGSGSKGGALFAIEPKYALSDNVTVGLRLESALTGDFTSDSAGTSGTLKASSSYLATADYYFSTESFRPFVGIGAGLYRVAAVNLETSDFVYNNKFGFMPRAGFEFKHLRFAVEYNYAGKTGDFSHNYIGVKLGFFAGGGRLE